MRGRGENFGPSIFPIAMWNKHSSAADGIARTTNIVEGWHHGLQSLFMCHHPTMWVFVEGLQKDCSKQRASYLQTVAGEQRPASKSTRN